MINHIRQKLFIIRKVRRSTSLLCKQVSVIRKHSAVLAICPTPTGQNWMGILRATEKLFPHCTFIIPQYYNQQALSNDAIKELAAFIGQQQFEQVIFSGFTYYFDEFIAQIRANDTKVLVGVIHHGGLAELSENRLSADALWHAISLLRSKKIHKLAFVKKDMAESLNRLYHIKSHELHIPETTTPKDIKSGINTGEQRHIGVLGNSTFNKNTHTQVVAALQVPNTIIHVVDKSTYAYLPQPERLVAHGLLNRADFIDLLSGMDLNLYLSFSESWGQIITESLALGVPCIASNNSAVFDYDAELKKILVVNENDNALLIAERIELVLKNRDELSKKCIRYMHTLNEISGAKLAAFLTA